MKLGTREFLHHEHSNCHPRVVVDPDGLVSVSCSTHSPEEDEPGLVIAARLCASASGTYGNLLLNVSLAPCPYKQAIKISGDHTFPRRVHRIDLTDMKLIQGTVDKVFSGYNQEECPNCPDQPGYMFAEQYAIYDTGTRYLVVLLRCRNCGAGRMLWFPAVPGLHVGRCGHNFSHQTLSASAIPPL